LQDSSLVNIATIGILTTMSARSRKHNVSGKPHP
jgi:hypothetical protein